MKREQRVWGNFSNLFESEGVKVKELVVDPGKGMSYQKHFHRSEIWLVSEGKCDVYHDQNGVDDEKLTLQKHEHLLVPVGSWHQIANPYEETCKIIEIQFGDACNEEDIVRRNYYNEEKPSFEEPEKTYIYESPDKGQTIYRREFGTSKREKVKEKLL